MKIISDTPLRNFKFWSGAKDRANMLTDQQLDELEPILEDLYPDGVDETTLNDLFWFDFEYVCSLIGLNYNLDTDEIED